MEVMGIRLKRLEVEFVKEATRLKENMARKKNMINPEQQGADAPQRKV